MIYEIKLKESVKEKLDKLSSDDKFKAVSAILAVARDPNNGKKMKGYLSKSLTVHIKTVRLVYRLHRQNLLILALGIDCVN